MKISKRVRKILSFLLAACMLGANQSCSNQTATQASPPHPEAVATPAPTATPQVVKIEKPIPQPTSSPEPLAFVEPAPTPTPSLALQPSVSPWSNVPLAIPHGTEPLAPPPASTALPAAAAGVAAAGLGLAGDQAALDTPATTAVEAGLRTLLDSKSGFTPPGSALSYTRADLARIQNYKLFVGGGLGVEEMMRTLFRDRDFNRAVQVVADLRKQDRLNGSLSPTVEMRFEELAQKTGDAVLVYNKRKRSDHYTTLASSVIVGTLLGATAGGFLLRDEWIPAMVRTRFGERIPGYVRNAIIGGTASGSVILITMETYHILSQMSHPSQAFNAEPLLDNPAP